MLLLVPGRFKSAAHSLKPFALLICDNLLYVRPFALHGFNNNKAKTTTNSRKSRRLHEHILLRLLSLI